MSYWDNALMAQDLDLRSRVTACAAQEIPRQLDPGVWASEHMLHITAAPGWDAAWSSAIAAGNETPGRDAGVITDGMILSEVQAEMVGPDPAPLPDGAGDLASPAN